MDHLFCKNVKATTKNDFKENKTKLNVKCLLYLKSEKEGRTILNYVLIYLFAKK